MKSIFLALLIATAEAFVPSSHVPRFGVSTSVLYAETSAQAIKAALEASKKYGATSKEARVAWDIVEEINASDNSAAYTGGVLDEDIHANSQAAQEYQEKLDALAKILDDQKAQIESVKELASSIRAIKLAKVESSPQPVTEAMVKALDEARALSKKHGVDSPEARLAWETVEDIAQDNFSEATKNDLTDECLIETIEACEAIEEIQRALHKNENVGSGRFSG